MSPLRSNANKIISQRGSQADAMSSFAGSRVGSQRNPDLVSQAPSHVSSNRMRAAAMEQAQHQQMDDEIAMN